MTKKMLIDATHAEETRVAVLDANRLDEYDYESASRSTLKGNIYLGKVTRVEPSLQAAFIDYGGNRHGFLPFSDIHPDYYRIPVADREALLSDDDAPPPPEAASGDDTVEELGETSEAAAEDEINADRRRTERLRRAYKIQEVIKRRQILLVQVTKEERGNKGAALTTYVSLAGRYCVLMPNTMRGGGISRKITDAKDRRRLKELLDQLPLPEGMAIILRTAGVQRTKTEIRRDYDFLIKLWDDIRERTLSSRAPALIYEEANLIKRTIRDIYTRDIEEVLVEGEEAYRTAKEFMRALMPSHARRVQLYKDKSVHLFSHHQVESQIEALHTPTVRLKSGGSIVINSTEALVAIDVNSGRSTRERNIEETALKTNLEAAAEIARQLRLRDLAGLIVIDFIDMEDRRNNAAVERKLKDAVRTDRARLQLGRISPLGLFEMSRQRLRPSLFDTSTHVCPLCHGQGYVRSIESTALHVLRAIEEEAARGRSAEIAVYVPIEVALYILNQKRDALHSIEREQGLRTIVERDDSLLSPTYRIEHRKDLVREIGIESEEEVVVEARAEAPPEPEPEPEIEAEQEEAAEPAEEARGTETEDGDGKPRRRRRGRRGGRRRGKREDDALVEAADGEGQEQRAEPESGTGEAAPEQPERVAPLSEEPMAEGPGSVEPAVDQVTAEMPVPEGPVEESAEVPVEAAAAEAAAVEAAEPQQVSEPEPAPKPKRPRSRRRKADATTTEKAETTAAEAVPAEAAKDAPDEEAPKPARRRRTRKAAKPAADEAALAAAPAEEAAVAVATTEKAAAPEVEAFVSDVPEPEIAVPAVKEEQEQPARPTEPGLAPERVLETAATSSNGGSADEETAVADGAPEERETTPEPTQPTEADRPRRRGWWQRPIG